MQRGAAWIVNVVPGDGTWWWRFRQWLQEGQSTPQKQALWGWSWTPGTSSWVEPTAYALLFLRSIRHTDVCRMAERRIRLAEALLYDRMCPGGGWNCGNPKIYGNQGDPQVMTTAWALLSLWHSGDQASKRKSLAWLESVSPEVNSPATAAIALACLRVYGRPTLFLEKKIPELFQPNQFLQNVRVAAWCALALLPGSCLYAD